MFRRLIEFILPYIVGVVIHRREALNLGEHNAQGAFRNRLDIKKRQTDKPMVVALVGLVGSGKSTVARELAGRIGATVIGGDDIRIELRKQGERYEKARLIAENAMIGIIKQGGNVILDSDFVDPWKRASLRRKARWVGARLVFVRTHCDLDVALGRVLTATYHNRVDDFCGGAKSQWSGDEQSKGAVVKIRELWRRTPHHCCWVNRGGGRWTLKKFSFTLFAEIDTTNADSWKSEVEKCAYRLLAW